MSIINSVGSWKNFWVSSEDGPKCRYSQSQIQSAIGKECEFRLRKVWNKSQTTTDSVGTIIAIINNKVEIREGDVSHRLTVEAYDIIKIPYIEELKKSPMWRLSEK